jgi:hypothetical protein
LPVADFFVQKKLKQNQKQPIERIWFLNGILRSMLAVNLQTLQNLFKEGTWHKLT